MKPINSHNNTSKTFVLANGTNICKGFMNLYGNTYSMY